jgi:hypothetical protein
MENVNIRIEGSKLIIEVDLSKNLGPSSSGKSTLIAKSGGNVPVPGCKEVLLGLNVYKKVAR